MTSAGRRLAILLCAVLAPASARAQMPHHACDAAASRAERDWNVPAGVLAAVGTVESGIGSTTGVTPWPWTINAAGRGAYFATKEEAVAGVLAIMARGYPYIDVGCFQIDIAYHPGVFRSLDEAFDPERNAQAAAEILAAERLRASDWAGAVARYHSATPSLGGPYLERVRAVLTASRSRASYAELQQELERGLTTPQVSAPERSAVAAGGPALPKVIYASRPTFPSRDPQVIRMPPAAASGTARAP